MTTTNPRQPTHRLFIVKGDGQTAKWLEIGAAWPNKDGQGYTLQLDAAPLDGRLVMREITLSENGGQS